MCGGGGGGSFNEFTHLGLHVDLFYFDVQTKFGQNVGS